jgi:sulfite dehydrogenase (cytochrome) subunit B
MTRTLAVGLVALLASAPVAAQAGVVSITLPPDQVAIKAGPGMELTQKTCQMCHSVDYITTQPRGGEAQWRGVVNKMIKVFGAPIGDEDARVVVEYLSREYGAGR